jgi:hypothetical protein
MMKRVVEVTAFVVALISSGVACHLATGNPEVAPRLGALAPISWSGDLDGSTLANQIVTGLEGHGLPPPAVGALQYDGGSLYWAGITSGINQLTGDIDAGPGTGSVAAIVQRINGATVPAAGSLTTGNTLGVTGSSALGYSALNLAGGAGYVTGLLPAANQVAQTMGGDITGTTAAAYVATLSGNSSASAPVDLTGTYLGVNGSGATYPTLGQVRASESGAGVDIVGGYTSAATKVLMAVEANALYLGGDPGFNNVVGTLNLEAINILQLYSATYGYGFYVNLGNAVAYFGGGSTSSPVQVTWSTSTAPTIQSGTSATSLTGGTQKNGASDIRQAGNAVTYLSSTAAGSTTGTAVTTLTGALAVTVNTVSSTYTIDNSTTDYEVWANTSGGSFTITLPAPTAGRQLVLVDSTNSFATHNLTLARHGSENIDGVAASKVYAAAGTRATITSDGTNWVTY